MRGARRRARTLEARDFARQLRKNSTAAERRLWQLLRDRRFSRFKFRRQYPLGPYYLDFFCADARLAIELDGGGHGFPEQKMKDRERASFLHANGIKVLRFWNHHLGRELSAVREQIWRALIERAPQKSLLPSEGRYPGPLSPPRGEG